MATITIDEIRSLGQKKVGVTTDFQKSASLILNEIAKSQTPTRNYDIFLSHSFKDAVIILGIKSKLEKFGYSIYIDWIEDPKLDRSTVNSITAKILRERMDCCRCLFYATTKSATWSRWMPWECGYIDGKKGKSAILPITKLKLNKYNGQEYLGLYPYITENTGFSDMLNKLWVKESPDIYCTLDEWLSGKQPRKH